jgi:hypothetical protein
MIEKEEKRMKEELIIKKCKRGNIKDKGRGRRGKTL